jgi:hypothetical protein
MKCVICEKEARRLNRIGLCLRCAAEHRIGNCSGPLASSWMKDPARPEDKRNARGGRLPTADQQITPPGYRDPFYQPHLGIFGED